MNITPQVYKEMTDKASPKSNSAANVSYAFLTGGTICLIGQIILSTFKNMGFSAENAGTWTSVILVTASALLTGLGWYERIAKHAGAGTLVPITGFANAIVSPSMEFKKEGIIFGICVKMFSIVGPVIVFGVVGSVLAGLIYLII